MDNEEHHGFRNFFLFIATLGLAWYLWKEREKIQEKIDALDNEPEPVIDVTAEETAIEIEAEPEEHSLEPAFVAPTPLEEKATVEAPLLASVPDLVEDEYSNEDEEYEAPEADEYVPEAEEPIEDEFENSTVEEIEDVAEALTNGPDLETEAEDAPLEDVEIETSLDTSHEELPQADEPGLPVADEPVKPPTWVRPVDGECPEGFPIKARFATGHFHEPGDRGYEKIIPDCCYPTTEDAEADGFTPSRWS
jgi:hypothetical protein